MSSMAGASSGAPEHRHTRPAVRHDLTFCQAYKRVEHTRALAGAFSQVYSTEPLGSPSSSGVEEASVLPVTSFEERPARFCQARMPTTMTSRPDQARGDPAIFWITLRSVAPGARASDSYIWPTSAWAKDPGRGSTGSEGSNTLERPGAAAFEVLEVLRASLAGGSCARTWRSGRPGDALGAVLR